MLAWTALRPSPIETRWRRAAALVSLGAALALASVAEGVAAWLLVVLLAGAAPLVWRVSRLRWRLRITPAGEFELAPLDAGEPAAARVVFVSRSLIVLACGRHAVALWPDSLSPDHFRLLSVHARWPAATRPAAGGGDEPG